MSQEEFMRQQYLTLRDEIRNAKARIFWLIVIGTLLIPAAAFAASAFDSTLASGAIPFVVLVLMITFIAEQNSIIRAGRYLREHVEPHIEGVIGWERWLESNRKLRSVDRIFFGAFILIFFIFYGVGTRAALESLMVAAPGVEDMSYHWITLGGYVAGGIFFLYVLLRHWHACTTTLE